MTASPTIGFFGEVFVSGSSGSITISTSQPNEVVMIIADLDSSSVSSVTSPSLGTFKYLSQIQSPNGESLSIYYAIAPQILLDEGINVSFAASTSGQLLALTIIGAYISSPFDPNISMPASSISNNNPLSLSVNISTTLPDDIIIAFMAANTIYVPIPPNMTYINLEIRRVGYLITNTSFIDSTFTTPEVTNTSNLYGMMIIAALTADPPPIIPSRISTTPKPQLPVWNSIGVDPIAGTLFKPVQTPILGSSVVQSLPVSGIIQPRNTVMLAGGGRVQGQIITRDIFGRIRRI